jgi:hypothetical protein
VRKLGETPLAQSTAERRDGEQRPPRPGSRLENAAGQDPPLGPYDHRTDHPTDHRTDDPTDHRTVHA